MPVVPTPPRRAPRNPIDLDTVAAGLQVCPCRDVPEVLVGGHPSAVDRCAPAERLGLEPEKDSNTSRSGFRSRISHGDPPPS